MARHFLKEFKLSYHPNVLQEHLEPYTHKQVPDYYHLRSTPIKIQDFYDGLLLRFSPEMKTKAR